MLSTDEFIFWLASNKIHCRRLPMHSRFGNAARACFTASMSKRASTEGSAGPAGVDGVDGADAPAFASHLYAIGALLTDTNPDLPGTALIFGFTADTLDTYAVGWEIISGIPTPLVDGTYLVTFDVTIPAQQSQSSNVTIAVNNIPYSNSPSTTKTVAGGDISSMSVTSVIPVSASHGLYCSVSSTDETAVLSAGVSARLTAVSVA